jgi:hypothetical protein
MTWIPPVVDGSATAFGGRGQCAGKLFVQTRLYSLAGIPSNPGYFKHRAAIFSHFRERIHKVLLNNKMTILVY